MDFNIPLLNDISRAFMDIINAKTLPPVEPLSVSPFLINFALGIVLSLIIAWYYVRYGQSLANRSIFAPIIPMLALITLLIISIIKASLALSLGLVGALSIVRFRTAIKDPEELVFIFFAIAVGVGLGADQRIPTIVGVVVIMAYLMIRSHIHLGRNSTHSLYLNIEVESTEKGATIFEDINKLLLQDVPNMDLRRLDSIADRLQVTYYLTVRNQDTLLNIMNKIKGALPGASVSIVEQNNLLGG